jgi:hypothetical protein
MRRPVAHTHPGPLTHTGDDVCAGQRVCASGEEGR